MTRSGWDPFTGLNRPAQGWQVDEAYLDDQGNFRIDQFNEIHGEQCDIGDVSSMAAIYDYSVKHFMRHIFPELDFLHYVGPVAVSCVSSLEANAVQRQIAMTEKKRRLGHESHSADSD